MSLNARIPTGTKEMSAPATDSRAIRFGVFEVDPRSGELRRNGIRVKLQEQPFQILLTLLEHPGGVVTREELRSRLWAEDTYVDFDHSLNAAVRRLRDALGDSAENPRFVETVARRGYRFLAPVNGAATTVISQPVPVPITSVRRFRIFFTIAVLLAGVLLGWIIARARRQSGQITSLPIKQRRLTASSEENRVLGAAISPDGKYLAFADKTGLSLRQIDSGETHSLTLPSGFAAIPSGWYPDGSHLVATWVEGPTAAPSLWQVSIIGGAPRKLIDNGQLPAISPDGSQIAFVKGPKHAEEIWLMEGNGENPRRLVVPCQNCTFGVPAWSPDGSEIAFVITQYTPLWRADTSVVLFNLRTGREETIFSSGGHQAEAGREMELGPALIWTSDNHLVYSMSEPPPNQDDSNVWSVPLDVLGHVAGSAVRLTAAPDEVSGLSASADGKRITYTKNYLSPGVYVSELNSGGTRLSAPQRLTLDYWRNYPFSWTADSKAVLFSSDRDGTFHIFKQGIDQSAPELLIGGNEETSLPRLAPDNATVIFEVWPKLGAPASPRRLMRVSLAGGPPHPVLQRDGLGNMQCARPPSDLCLYDLRRPTQVSFFRFDPMTGDSAELPQLRIQDASSYAYNWTLSPDGKILATGKGKILQREPSITFTSVEDGSKRTVTAQAWAGINSIDFAADSRSVWASAYTNTGKWALLNIDLQGRTKTMLEDAQMAIGWAIPSPDGKHLALWKASGNSNVWMLEKF
jgi:DNA-binding winged helix-turn-helix (wHTH) protein/Tol biopolymer transport system component